MNHNLIVSIPGSEPVLYELKADRIGVGRGPENQIQIDLDTISSTHCEIRKNGDEYEVVDLKSKNGVRVNGLSADEPVFLEDGDRVLIGETVPAYFVEVADGEAPAEAAAKGSESDQKVAANYVSLEEKVQDLERKLLAMRAQLEQMQTEHQELTRNIGEIETDIEKKESAGASDEELGELRQDLIQKTQRVSILKADIEQTEKQASDLEKTAKTSTTAAEQPAPPTPAGSPPVPSTPKPPGPPAVKVAPATPPSPGAPPTAQPVKPASAGALPPNVGPLKPPGAAPVPGGTKPPAPAIPLPPATPKKPPGS